MTTTIGEDLIRDLNVARLQRDKAESELFALGVQVAALKERLRLAEAVAEAARLVVPRWLGNDLGIRTLKPLQDALAAFDAVPGDVSADPMADHIAATMEAVANPETLSVFAPGQHHKVTCLCGAPWVALHPNTGAARCQKCLDAEVKPDPHPRYASGEVPMVGDVVMTNRDRLWLIDGFDEDGDIITDEPGPVYAKRVTLVRRAAPPAPDLLARAVALLREHAYDVRVRDFLSDFDKGGV